MPSSTGTLVFNDQKIQAPDIYATESLGVGVSDPTSNLEVVGNAYVSSNLEVGTANLFVDTTTGNVGIGTASPGYTLDINGYAKTRGQIVKSSIANNVSRPAITDTIQPYEIRALGTPPGGDLTDTTAANGFLRIGAGGGVGSGDYVSYIDLSGYSSVGDMNRNIVFGTSRTERMRITNVGNVGIGTANPSVKLHVNGSINHGNYNYISGGEAGGYKDIGNGVILLWGYVIVNVTTAKQYNWTWYFPNSLTLSDTYCATAEISDPARGLSYPGAFTLLGVSGLNTNRISGNLKSQDVSNGNISIWIMAIGQKA